MTNGLLENIIQLEKQIQAEVAGEQLRAATWQAQEEAVMRGALIAARTEEELRYRQQLQAGEATLRDEVAALESAAQAWCQRLEDLDDATLSILLKQQLAALLPGGEHDHPHGQG